MASFNTTIITKEGHRLMTYFFANEEKMKFTKAQTTDIEYLGDDLYELLEFESPKQDIEITKIDILNQKSLQITCPIDNENLEEGYFVRTIGLYAENEKGKEVLYAIATTIESDFMPKYEGTNLSTITLELIIAISNTANVEITIDRINGVSHRELEQALEGINSDINGLQTQINTNKTNIATNETNITSNLTQINTNKTNIATNTTNIASNLTKINDLSTKYTEVLQLGVDAKNGLISAINSKTSVPNVSSSDAWELLIQRVWDIVEGRILSYEELYKDYPVWFERPEGNVPQDFDISTVYDNWIEAKPMLKNRFQFASSTVGDFIYCIGGLSTQNSIDYYNAISNEWVERTNMPTGRYDLTSSAVGNAIYCIGGVCTNSSVNEMFTTTSNTWTTRANMTTSRTCLTSQSISNEIFCIGGNNVNEYLYRNECYNSTTNVWSLKTDMITNRKNLVSYATTSYIYALGGQLSDETYSNKLEVYNSFTNLWTTKTNMPSSRSSLCFESINKNDIYAVNGYNGSYSRVFANECYNVISNTWTTKKRIITGRSSSSSGSVGGYIYILGGETGVASSKNECYIAD